MPRGTPWAHTYFDLSTNHPSYESPPDPRPQPAPLVSPYPKLKMAITSFNHCITAECWSTPQRYPSGAVLGRMRVISFCFATFLQF